MTDQDKNGELENGQPAAGKEHGSGSEQTGEQSDTASKQQKKSRPTHEVLDELGRKNKTEAKKKSGGSRGALFLLFLLVLVLAAGGGWLGWQQWQGQRAQQATLSSLHADNQRLQEELDNARSEISDARSELDRARSELDTIRSDLNQDIEQLSGLLQTENSLRQSLSALDDAQQLDEQRFDRLQQEVGQDVQDVSALVTALQRQVANLQQRDARWLNAEANYLMRLAQRKLQLEHDIASAVLVLNTIDRLLESQTSLMATTARQNIQQDIEALQAVRLPDRAAIAARLNELSGRLDQLSFSSSRREAYQESLQERWEQGNATATVDDEATWNPSGWVAGTLDLLRTVFVWRELDPEEPLFMQPDQEQLLKQQMLLQLEQARLAMVQGDQQLFELTLSQLSSLLGRYLAQDSLASRSLREDVEALAEISVDVSLPDLSDSAALVQQLASSSAVREE